MTNLITVKRILALLVFLGIAMMTHLDMIPPTWNQRYIFPSLEGFGEALPWAQWNLLSPNTTCS
jgi:hypothetical protein